MRYPESCKHQLPKKRLQVDGSSEKLAIILPGHRNGELCIHMGRERKKIQRFYLSNISDGAAAGFDRDRNGLQGAVDLSSRAVTWYHLPVPDAPANISKSSTFPTKLTCLSPLDRQGSIHLP